MLKPYFSACSLISASERPTPFASFSISSSVIIAPVAPIVSNSFFIVFCARVALASRFSLKLENVVATSAAPPPALAPIFIARSITPTCIRLYPAKTAVNKRHLSIISTAAFRTCCVPNHSLKAFHRRVAINKVIASFPAISAKVPIVDIK